MSDPNLRDDTPLGRDPVNGACAAAPGRREFVALAGFAMAVFALSVDSVLPALAAIGRELGTHQANDDQLVVSLLILGMAIGQPFYGPLADSIGRKPSIYAGLLLFSLGCAMSASATRAPVMLAGRFLQGLGAAGPRVVVLALMRDRYGGAAMARMMSLVLTVHMTLLIAAPFLGQMVLLVAHWRAIFLVLMVLGLVLLAWLGLRQPETLPSAYRTPFRWRPIAGAVMEACRSRVAFGYTVTAGLALGALFGYVTSARQIFQELYGVGAYFPFYFSVLALPIGGATLLNARLVLRFGMRTMCRHALWAQVALSLLFFGVALASAGKPVVWAAMLYFAAVLFCLGILFGNFNALAMEPLGHLAGTAAGVVGSGSWLIAMIVGTTIGQSYNGTLLPLTAGFGILALGSLGVMHAVEPRRTT